MKPRSPTFKSVPLNVVGSTRFGRYKKINPEETFNMIISDEWQVPYSGYMVAKALSQNGKGRAIYTSFILGKMFAVVYNNVYLINSNLSYSIIGTLDTFSGDVFIAEDIQGQVGFCDKNAVWIYSPASATTWFKATISITGFLPNYISYHDGRFLITSSTPPTSTGVAWTLSNPAASPSNSVFPGGSQYDGEFQTKADIPVAVVPFPGHSNLVFVMGSTVTELWYDNPLAQLFPYQRSSSVNIDYGCANSDSIAYLDNYLCWIGINEKAGVSLMVSTGGIPERITTDGIDYKLATLSAPNDCHGFMFREDGHLFYHFVFPTDNISYTYDFNTKKFFTVTNQYMDYHIAKRVAYFNNTYYFVSLTDGNLYEMSTKDTTYNGFMIPRVRVCPTIRMPNNSPFVTNNVTLTIEQGIDGSLYDGSGPQNSERLLTTEAGLDIDTQDSLHLTVEGFSTQGAPNPPMPPLPAVDMAISINGGYNFGNFDRMQLQRIGKQMNRFIYYNLGWSNEITCQFRFWSYGRIVYGNGLLDLYQ